MLPNPYQSPTALSEGDGDPATRSQAKRALRMALLVLLPPALLNYAAFDSLAIESSTLPGDVKLLYRTINLSAFAVGSIAIWIAGIGLLEGVAEAIRRALGSRASREQWRGVLYQSMRSMVAPATVGAVLWVAWVFGIYVLNVDFMTVSIAVAVPAHLLAALVYLPLLYRWWKLALGT
jgi:hypothetical protein